MIVKNRAEQRRPFGNPMFQIQAAWVGLNVPGSDDRGVLQLGRIDHGVIKPGFDLPMHPHETDEILSYLRKGTMAHRDSENNLETINSSKLMMMNSGSGIQHAETVPSNSEDVEMLQIFIRPEQDGLKPSVQFHEFPSETSVNKWRLIAGHKESEAPLIVNSQITIFDNHLTQPSDIEVEQNMQVVIYVFDGSVSVGDDVTLGKGDSLVADESLRITLLSSSADLVLFNLDETSPFSRNGSYSG